MPIIRSVEWLDQNTERNYPLTLSSSGEAAGGAFQLPTDFLVGLRIAVHHGMVTDPGGFYLKSLSVFPSGFGIVIGYDSDSGPVLVASTTIARAAFTEFGQYRLNGLGDFFDTDGYIVLGQLVGLDAQPTGQFEFEPDDARLEVDCIVPMIRGVTGVRVDSGAGLSRLLTGTLVFTARRNQQISIIEEGGETQIVWDAVEGAGLNEPCVCDDTVETQCIETIGDVTPVDGRIVIHGSNCLTVEEGDGSINLDNTCSKPCCGREELATLTQALETLSRQNNTFETRLANLESRTTQFEQLILGSQLGDGPCLSCDD